MSIMRLGRSLVTYGVGAALVLNGLGVLLPTVSRAASNTLVISELNWAGSPTDTHDQWVELANTDTVPIDFSVTPYELSIPSESENILLDASYGTLAPNQYLVISHNTLANSSIHALVGTNYVVDPTLVLPTAAAEYDLVDVTTSTTVDQISDAGSGIPFAGTMNPVASMTRADLALPGSDVHNWYTSETIGAGFNTLPTDQYGTPGAVNVNLKAPTANVTPAGSTTLPTPPKITGNIPAPGTTAYALFTRVSHDPSSYTHVYKGVTLIATGGAYSLVATPPDLPAGRYYIDVYAADNFGNRSKSMRFMNDAYGSVFPDYEVLASSSTVPMPVITAPANNTLTNQPTVTVTGTLDTGTTYDSLEVLRNGYYDTTVPVTGSTFSFPVDLLPNQSNFIQVVGVDTNGTFSVAANVTVNNDMVGPNAVDLSKVTLNANPPGTDDSFFGQPGAAEANTQLYVYGDAGLTQLIGSPVTVGADGSFPLIDIGDNTHPQVYLILQDAAGNRSPVAILVNPTSYNPGLTPTVTSVTPTQATITWNKVDTAVKYRVEYRTSGGSFGAPTDVCINGNATCSFSTTLDNLFSDTDYVFAIAAIDQYGNVSPYSTVNFHTSQAPVVVPTSGTTAPTATLVDNTTTTPAPTNTGTTDKVTNTATVTPSPTPTPSPTAAGDVKSASTTATSRNWTPWIVLAVLAAIAILATAGYFYWFGGEAGEAALGSVLAERAKRENEDAKPDTKKKPGGKDRRW